MLPQPWSRPRLPFSATRRPNSLMVTTVTRERSAGPRSRMNAFTDCANPETMACICPCPSPPYSLCMSQEP